VEIANKRFLVVGASGVLGGEIVKLLTEKRAIVSGSASSNDSAAKIPAKVEVRLLLDLTSPESIKTLSDYLIAATELDGIINAAGVVAFGEVKDLTAETVGRLMAINASGPMQLFSTLTAKLAEKEESVVVNITGVVAETPLPGIAAYSASKFAIDGFLAAAAREWRRHGIRAISARPGHTETGLASRAIAGEAPKFPEGMTAQHVAQRIVAAIENDEKELPSTAF
jgi:short-subunit dehydrogenase